MRQQRRTRFTKRNWQKGKNARPWTEKKEKLTFVPSHWIVSLTLEIFWGQRRGLNFNGFCGTFCRLGVATVVTVTLVRAVPRVWVGVCVARINDVGADRFTECFVMFRLLYLSSFLNDAIVIIVVVVVCFVFGTVRIFDAFILIEIHTRLVGSVTKQSFL